MPPTVELSDEQAVLEMLVPRRRSSWKPQLFKAGFALVVVGLLGSVPVALAG